MARKFFIGKIIFFMIAFAFTLNTSFLWAENINIDDDESRHTGQIMHKQKQLEIIKMLAEVNRQIDSGGDEVVIAKKFFEKLAEMGLKSPMVELNKIKTRLGEQQRVQTLGEQFVGGGTPVEKALLSYRRDVTFEAIRMAVAETRQKLGTHSIDSSVYLAKIGKWTTQNAEMMVFAGDIDFSFVGADLVVIQELTHNYKENIKKLTGLDMVALDSVATAHGFAEHMVYIGEQGRKYGDDAIMQMGKEGIEMIDFSHPNAIGQNRPDLATTGEVALWIVVLEETIRKHNGKVSDFSEIDRNWQQRREQIVEPFLSMEMVRHLEGDIIANMDVFKAIDLAKKGSKYFRRSNDQMNGDMGLPSSNPALAEFARKLDNMAKNATAAELAKFVATESKKIGMPFFDFQIKNGKASLQISSANAKRFLEKIKKSIWKNVSDGFDARIRILLEAKNTQDPVKMSNDQSVEQMRKTLDMLTEGLRVMNQEGTIIPREIRVKMEVLFKLIASQHNRRAYRLPAGQIEELHKLLEQAGKAPNIDSRLLLVGIAINRIDKYMTKHYDAISIKLPGNQVMSFAGAKIDALNSVLDGMDNVLLANLRNDGIIKYDRGHTDKHGKKVFSTIASFPKIATINRRLNDSILGRIGNSTAFKGINLYQEGDAYYHAFANAKSPSEAFENLAIEIFRRRVPAGVAVEAYMMENYLRMGIEVVYTIFPPTAIPEGIYGMAKSTALSAQAVYWNSELELLADKMYANAKFKQINQKDKEMSFRLESIEYKSRTFTRKELLSKNSDFIMDNDVDDMLWAKLHDMDPFLLMLKKLQEHPAAGQKVVDKFTLQAEERWRSNKKKFIQKMINRLEKRRAVEQLLDIGDLEERYNRLMKITDDLHIKVSVQRNINEEWDSGLLKLFWQYLVNDKRTIWNQPLPQSEKNRFVTIIIEYIDAYSHIIKRRDSIEKEIRSWFSRTDQPEPSQITWYQLRILTGISSLTGNAKKDLAITKHWGAVPSILFRKVTNELKTIKSIALQQKETLDTPFDQQMNVKIAYKDIGIELYTKPSVPTLTDASVKQRYKTMKHQRDKLIMEYKKHYSFSSMDNNDSSLTIQIVTVPTLEQDGFGNFLLNENDKVTLSVETLKKKDSGKINYQWSDKGKSLGIDKSIIIRGKDLNGDVHKISVIVIDEKKPANITKEKNPLSLTREAIVSINLKGVVTKGILVTFSPYPREILEDKDLYLSLNKTNKAKDLTYEWYEWDGRKFSKNISSKKRSCKIGANKVGIGGVIKAKVVVRDKSGHTGEAITEEVKVIAYKSKADTLIEEGNKLVEQDHLREALEKFEESLKYEPNQQIEDYIEKIKKELALRDAEDTEKVPQQPEVPKSDNKKTQTIKKPDVKANSKDDEATKTVSPEKNKKTEKEWISKIEEAFRDRDCAKMRQILSISLPYGKDKVSISYKYPAVGRLLSKYIAQMAREKEEWFKKDVLKYLRKVDSLLSGQDSYNLAISQGRSMTDEEEACHKIVKSERKRYEKGIKEHKEVLRRLFDLQGSDMKICNTIEKFVKKYEIPISLEIPQKYKNVCNIQPQNHKFSIKISSQKNIFLFSKESVTLEAEVVGGKSPVTVSWEGENISPNGSTAIFIASSTPGSYTVQVVAKDASGQSAYDAVSIRVKQITLPVLSGLPNEVYYGTSKIVSVEETENNAPKDKPSSGDPCKGHVKNSNPFDPCNKIIITKDSHADSDAPGVIMLPADDTEVSSVPEVKKEKEGKYEYVWISSEKGVEFNPPSGKKPQVKVTFGNIGNVEIWAEVHKDGELIGETEPIKTKIIPPKFTLSVKPEILYMGDEGKATITVKPNIDNKFTDFRWLPMGKNAQKLIESGNGRSTTFKLRSIKPASIEVLVYAKSPYYGGEIGKVKYVVSAKPYKVSVSKPKRLDKAPWKWDLKQGKAVELPNAIAVFQNAEVHAIITPEPKERVSYKWTVTPEGCTISAPMSKSTNLNAHEVKTYVVTVKVSDKNGIELGTSSISHTVTVSQRDLDVAKQKAKEQQKEKELLQEGRKLWKKGKLKQAITKLTQAQKLVGKDKEISKTFKAMQRQKKELNAKLEKASSLIKKGKLKDTETILSQAARISDTYEKYKEVLKQLADAKKKAEEKKKQIAKFLKDAKALKDSGKLDEAVGVLQKGNKLFPGNKEIIKLLKEVKKQQKDALSKMAEGQAQWKNGLLDKAISTLKEVAKIDPSNKKIAKALQGMQGQKKMMDDALNKADKKIKKREFKQAKNTLVKVGYISKKYFPYGQMLIKLNTAEKEEKVRQKKVLEEKEKRAEAIHIAKAEAERKAKLEEEAQKRKEAAEKAAKEEAEKKAQLAKKIKAIREAAEERKRIQKEKEKKAALAEKIRRIREEAEKEHSNTNKVHTGISENFPSKTTGTTDNSSDGYWQLVEEKGSIGRECTPQESSDYYRDTVSGFGSHVVITKMIREGNQVYCKLEGKWQRPPEKLYPERTINLPVTINRLADTGKYLCYMTIYFDTHDMECGSSGAGGDIGGVELDRKGPKSLSKKIPWKVKEPFHKKAGEKLTIRACYNAQASICGKNRGMKYYYKWIPDGSAAKTSIVAKELEEKEKKVQLTEKIKAIREAAEERTRIRKEKEQKAALAEKIRRIREEAEERRTSESHTRSPVAKDYVADDPRGEWSTSQNEMNLYRNGQRVNGTYATDGGKVFGELKGSVLYGYWSEKDSDQKCSQAMNGNYHWGRIVLRFNENAFEGFWGYCNDEPSHSWTGTRIKSSWNNTGLDTKGIEGIEDTDKPEINKIKMTPVKIKLTATKESYGGSDGTITSHNTLTFFNVGAKVPGYGRAELNITSVSSSGKTQKFHYVGTFTGGPNGDMELSDGEMTVHISVIGGERVDFDGLNFSISIPNPSVFDKN